MSQFATMVMDADRIIALAQSSESSFLLDGLVSRSISLWYGQSEIGKSRLVCGFIAAMLRGQPFLGRDPQAPVSSILLLTADAGGDREYSRRLTSIAWAGLTLDEMKGRLFLPISTMDSSSTWSDLRETVDLLDPSLVILDPLTRVINGDLNEGRVVSEFYAGVDSLRRPTIIVGHSSSKPGENGRRRASQTPMGHTSLISNARWRVEMLADHSGQLSLLKATGNDGPAVDLHLLRGPGLTDFSVTEEVAVQVATKQRQEDAQALHAQRAAWVVEECQGMSVRAAGEAMAKHFNMGISTGRNALTGKGSVRALLAVRVPRTRPHVQPSLTGPVSVSRLSL